LVDITERRKTEEIYELIANVTTDLIYEWDIITDELRWFGDIDKKLGYDPGEIPPTIAGWIELINPEDRAKLSDSVERHRISTELIYEEYRVRKKDGTWQYWADVGRPVLGRDGLPVKWIGGCTDISQRKRAEETLKDSEELFRKLFNSSKDAIMTINPPDWRFNSGNPAILDMFDIKDPKEFLALTPWDLSPATQPDGRDSAEKARAMIEIAMSKGSNYFEWEHKKLNGPAFPATVLLTRVDLKSGTFIQATVRNITEQKRNEKVRNVIYQVSEAASTSKDLNDLYRAIHQHLSEVIDTTNFFIALIEEEEGLMSFPYFVDEFDIPPGPTKLRKTISEHVYNCGRSLYLKEQDILNLARGDIIDLDVSGTVSQVWMGVPLKVNNQAIGVLVVQDYHDPDRYSESDLDILNFVSEQIAVAIARKQADEVIRESERKFRVLSEQLSAANSMKELLIDVITHDLKNPAGVISGMTDMLLADNPRDEMITLVKESSDNLLSVIDNAATLSQVALGEEIELTDINLKTVVADAVEGFQSLLADENMTVINKIDTDLPIKANPILIEVFNNFISNAIKYAFVGQRLELDYSEDKNRVTIEVRDFGLTIPEENRQLIFSRSVQFCDGLKRGRGLGLAIVKRIADAHNAEIGVRPNQPTGNIFYITFQR
ncbi:MAG: ATP-binding protein, partial [Candidatus Neomarinimicrobiota bacterium]